MTYTVTITPDALQDMEDIYCYIANVLQSPEYAIGQYKRLADAILSLGEYPEKYRLVLFEPERTMRLHQMVVDNYSVFYLIHEATVTVTNVLYNASDLENRIKE